MAYRLLQFWQGDEGYAILDFYDDKGRIATIRHILDLAPESDIVDDTRDVSELPDLPAYSVFGHGSGYLVQYNGALGHVALYAEV